MPGRNRYWQVLRTYWRRPAFGVLFIAALFVAAVFSLFIFGNQKDFWSLTRSGSSRDALSALYFYVAFFVFLSPVFLLIAFTVTLLRHLREQLDSPACEMVPGFRQVHLWVATLFFLLVPLLILGVPWIVSRVMGPPGPVFTPHYRAMYRESQDTAFRVYLAVTLSLMTLSALWAMARTTWHMLLLVPLFVAALALTGFIENFLMDQQFYTRVYATEIIGVNVLVLAALRHRLAQPRREPRPRVRQSQGSAPADFVLEILAERAHHPIASPLARAWHRRHGVLDPLAPWAVAGILAILLVVSAAIIGHLQSDLLRSLLLPTVVPGVAISLIWRERWGNLGYESLYPARRADFVGELAIATAIHLAELWVATTIAAMIPIAIWDPKLMASPIVCATLLASAAMQFMVFGVMFAAALFRATLLYVNLLTILAALIPITFAWADKPMLSPRGLLAVAIVQMACGIALTFLGYAAWRRTDLA